MEFSILNSSSILSLYPILILKKSIIFFTIDIDLNIYFLSFLNKQHVYCLNIFCRGVSESYGLAQDMADILNQKTNIFISFAFTLPQR